MSDKIDIFSIPLYYIGFNKSDSLEDYLSGKGFKNINFFSAVIGKKLDVKDLARKSIISPSCYYDIIRGRCEGKGFPSKGAIGCSLSHIELWKKCVNENLPFMTICEDDLFFEKKIKEDDIIKALKQENGMFLSPNSGDNINMNKRNVKFFGTHFYILSKECCIKLLEKAFPIDIQVDSYIAFMHNINEINIYGYKIAYQKSHISSTQQVFEILNNSYSGLYLMISIIILIISIFYFNRKCVKKYN